MKIVCITPFHYGGKKHAPGDILNMPRSNARVFVAIRKAMYAGPEPEPVEIPQPQIEETPKPEEIPKKRTYKRRDLTAED